MRSRFTASRALSCVLHLFDRGPWLQASDAAPAVAVAGIVGTLSLGQRQRNPEADAGTSERELRREDADDREVATGDAQRTTDGRRIAAKELAPEPVAEDDSFFIARGAFVLGEDAPMDRTCAKETQERWRGHDPKRACRDAAHFDRRAGVVVKRLLLEHRDVSKAILVVGCGAARLPPCFDERVLIGHQEYPLRLRRPERMQQHGVDASHDRRVASETDGERDDGGDGEPPVLPEHPPGECQVLQPAVETEERAQPRGAVLL